jgi:hypothetical protein
MYLMYVDESGDCGMPSAGSPSALFCLSGLVVHELRWRDTMTQLLRFRHWLKGRYKVYLDDELNAAEMIAKPSKVASSLQRLSKHERLAIIRHFADEIATLADVSIINVVVCFASTRRELIQGAWCGSECAKMGPPCGGPGGSYYPELPGVQIQWNYTTCLSASQD